MKKLSKIGIAALAVVGMGTSAYAAGTTAGTVVTNSASVNYTINTQPQPTVSVDTPDSFVVDAKINAVLVGTSGDVAVDPGNTDVASVFTAQNVGNHDTVFQVSFVNDDTSGDGFNLTDVEFEIDTNGDGTFDVSGVGPTIDFTLVADDIATIRLIGDVPGDVAQGAENDYEITLTPLDAIGGNVIVNDTAADDQGTMDYVVLDGSAAGAITTTGDFPAKQTGDTSFSVNNAELTIEKESVVVSDPFNSSNPKRIPGAVIGYTINVISGGTATSDAEGVIVTDDLADLLASASFAANAVVTIDDGTNPAYTEEIGNVLSGTILTVNLGTVTAQTTAAITFEVTIDAN